VSTTSSLDEETHQQNVDQLAFRVVALLVNAEIFTSTVERISMPNIERLSADLFAVVIGSGLIGVVVDLGDRHDRAMGMSLFKGCCDPGFRNAATLEQKFYYCFLFMSTLIQEKSVFSDNILSEKTTKSIPFVGSFNRDRLEQWRQMWAIG
jgi:hypothetical protein